MKGRVGLGTTTVYLGLLHDRYHRCQLFKSSRLTGQLEHKGSIELMTAWVASHNADHCAIDSPSHICSKTEFLWCTTARHQHQLLQSFFSIGSDALTPSSVVIYLGIYIDPDLSMSSHIQWTVTGCYSTSAVQYQTNIPIICFPVCDRCFCADEAGLR